MQEKIEITKDFLVKEYPLPRVLKAFDKRFPSGVATIPRFLKFCEELNLFALAQSIIRNTPKNPEPLVLDEYPGGSIFYNGDINIKKGFECSGNIICKNLIVDGVLVIGKTHWIWANIDAVEIDLRDAGVIKGKVATYKFRMSGISILMGLIATKWKST